MFETHRVEKASSRRRGSRRMRRVLLAAALVALPGCAPRQFIPIDIEPAPTAVFVDQKPVALVNGGLELRADRPHVLYFKREGYQPLPVVIESRETARGPALEPRSVRGRLRPRMSGSGEVSIEELPQSR